jgi:hypothetical protein
MSYASCPAHDFPRNSCEECRSRRPTFDPSQNLELVALKSAWQDIGPGADDLPDPSLILTEGVDADGMVTRVRALTALEVLELMVRDVRGEVE